MKPTFYLTALTGAVIAALSAPTAFASGYHFGTQSVSVQSTANASSVEASTPGTIFYNPAGLSKLPGTQVTANLITVVPEVNYKNANAQYFTTTPITGTRSGSIAKSVILVPHFYASHQFTPKLSGGIGVYVPFGAGINYDDQSVMRYSVKETELKTIDIHPTIAYDFQNGHSIGAGLIAQYANASIGKDVDFAPSLATALHQHIPSGSADVDVKVKGHDWGFGYNLGWMWDINDDVRVGVSYRSKIKHVLHGTARWALVGPVFHSKKMIDLGAGHNAPFGVATSKVARDAGYVATEGASVQLITPESLSLQGMVKLNPRLDLFGDITWTRHSRFNTLDVQYANKKVVPDVTGKRDMAQVSATRFKPNWRDTYKVSIGAAYQLNDQWQLRGGIAYDQSPVRSVAARLPTMPDNDRLMLSIGSKYNITKNQSLDMAYTFIHIKDASVDSRGYCGGSKAAGPGAVNCVSDRTRSMADYNSNAHFFGLQYTYRF